MMLRLNAVMLVDESGEKLLMSDVARERGFSVQTAQVRTDNAAGTALHRRLGFAPGEPWINRKGNDVVTLRKEL